MAHAASCTTSEAPGPWVASLPSEGLRDLAFGDFCRGHDGTADLEAVARRPAQCGTGTRLAHRKHERARRLFRQLGLQPSRAMDFRHGFSWMAKYFPEGRTLTAQIEERLWGWGWSAIGRDASPVVFDDQYISTGGAFCELLAGHDRLVGDLRPLVYRPAGSGVIPRLSSLRCLHRLPARRSWHRLRASARRFSRRADGYHQRHLLDRLRKSTLADLARPVLQRCSGDFPGMTREAFLAGLGVFILRLLFSTIRLKSYGDRSP